MARTPEYPVDRIFVGRWSPRAMSGETIDDNVLMSLFEAARWAPSSRNEQPWRFFYAKRDSRDWELFFSLLNEGNRKWCHRAGALLVVAYHKRFSGNNAENITASFSAGSAYENLALQGHLLGLVVHGIGGFDYDRAKKELHMPDDIEPIAMAAIGEPGRIEKLEENFRKREFPSDRKNISEFVFEGIFRQSLN